MVRTTVRPVDRTVIDEYLRGILASYDAILEDYQSFLSENVGNGPLAAQLVSGLMSGLDAIVNQDRASWDVNPEPRKGLDKEYQKGIFDSYQNIFESYDLFLAQTIGPGPFTETLIKGLETVLTEVYGGWGFVKTGSGRRSSRRGHSSTSEQSQSSMDSQRISQRPEIVVEDSEMMYQLNNGESYSAQQIISMDSRLFSNLVRVRQVSMYLGMVDRAKKADQSSLNVGEALLLPYEKKIPGVGEAIARNVRDYFEQNYGIVVS